MILATFGEIGLSFSVYNILKKYVTSDDIWTKATSQIKLSFFFVTRVPPYSILRIKSEERFVKRYFLL